MSALDINDYASTDLRGTYAYHEQLKKIFYGPGVVETALPELLNLFGAKKAVIVTGKSLFEKVRSPSD